MKKFTKILALVLVLAAAMSLTSCLALDKAKENRMTAKDNWNKIEFRGKTYKMCAGISSCTTWNFMFPKDSYKAATEDVPILLIRKFGSTARYDEDLDVIMNGEYYFPEDKYDEYAERFSNPVFNKAVCDKMEYDAKKDEYIYLPSAMPDSVSKAVTDALAMGEKITGDACDAIRYGGTYVTTFYLTTDDMKIVMPHEIGIIERNGEYFVDAPMSELYKLPEAVWGELRNAIEEN